MKSQYREDYIYGTGSALNIEVGFIPDYVQVSNLTDGDDITIGYMAFCAAFTSGGTATVAEGDVLVGATSGATARVKKVILTSGSFAAGTAAGTLIFYKTSMVGTFTGGELLYQQNNSTGSVDDCTLTAAPAAINIKITTAAATATTVNSIQPYIGSSGSAAKGFTIGATLSESGKLLHWAAWRSDD
jgi:hypothetical protein